MSISDRTGNYRDVGEALGLWLEPSPIPSGVLLRGGKFDTLTSASELGNPRTILNLRQGPDPKHLEGVAYLHVPAANDVENYDTSQREVRAWVARAIGVLARRDTASPVYVHCTSGRDRTGLVVAAALFFLGLPREVIVEEFLLSDGAERSLIEGALAGIAQTRATLGVDVPGLQAALLGPAVAGARAAAGPAGIVRGSTGVPLSTRAEAVRYLRCRGVFAEERDWILGKTVVACVEPVENDLGFEAYKRAMYIVPEGLHWTCFELDHPRPEDRDHLSLAEACARVAAILSCRR